MIKNPLFSIIVPVYRAEKYLHECIRSIQNQACSNFEIILVDDGSPDTCPRICDELAKCDHRIKVSHTTNNGASAARKYGAEMARGEYLFFLDADDTIAIDCLSTIERQIVRFAPDIVCFGINYENNKNVVNSVPLNYRYGFYSKADIEREIFPLLIQKNDATYFTPSLCGKAIKTHLFLENALVNRNCTIGEDGACAIPCVFYADSLVVLKDCFYNYRYNNESATKGKKVISWDCPKIIYDHITSRVDQNQFDFREQLYRKLVHDTFSVVVSQFNRNETYGTIIRDIRLHLNDALYSEAIENCSFSHSIAALLMKASLKYRLFFLIYIYSRI